jgi:predicted DCC family thiol-disulfide oxidoreductase YuxK
VSAYQDVDLPPLGLTADECAEALRYVDPSGATYRGDRAVDAFLRDSGSAWRWVRAPLHLPGTAGLWARLYDTIARNRTRLPGGTPRCEVPRP